MLADKGRDERVEFRFPVRYRLEPEARWRMGEVVNLSSSGVLRICEQNVEVGRDIVFVLPVSIGPERHELRMEIECLGTVRGRNLSNWPDVHPAIALKFVSYTIQGIRTADGLLNP